jgi:microcystin-dependent protein
MSTTTPLMSLVLPTPGPLGTLGPDWALNLNTAFNVVDLHDHTTGKGSRVPVSAININSDLNMAGYNSSEARSYKCLNNLSALSLSTDVSSLYVAGGDLYYNNASGTQVKITSGSGINLTSVGSIGGDYSTSSASLSYSAVSTDFSFTSVPGITASITCGSVKISEEVSGGKYVKLQTPVGLGSNYDLTFMTGLPASTLPVMVDPSGVMTNAQIVTSQITDANVTRAKLETILQDSFCPVGSVQMFAGASAPTGFLLCDGSAIDRTTYANLFAAISTTWGIGDGSTTFNIPDFRGIFPKGSGTTNRNGLGQDSQGNFYTATLGAYSHDQFQVHFHAVSIGSGGSTQTAIGASSIGLTDPNINTGTVARALRTDSTYGSPRAGVITQPQAAAINFIIKY